METVHEFSQYEIPTVVFCQKIFRKEYMNVMMLSRDDACVYVTVLDRGKPCRNPATHIGDQGNCECFEYGGASGWNACMYCHIGHIRNFGRKSGLTPCEASSILPYETLMDMMGIETWIPFRDCEDRVRIWETCCVNLET